MPGRFLWRDTFQYIRTLHASVAPSALESCAAREAVLEAMGQDIARATTGVETKIDVARLSAMEADALRILDVPLFGTLVGDTAIHGPGGDVVPDQFKRSGADALHDRVAQLGMNDVEVAVAFLRAAMDAARSGLGDPVVVRRPLIDTATSERSRSKGCPRDRRAPRHRTPPPVRHW